MIVAPFPYTGGKRKVTNLVWPRFGNVPNYVEPFVGSAAMLLGRPFDNPGHETINDADCFVANFWRCFSFNRHDPDAPVWAEVARWADSPVNEADLTARHTYLINQPNFIAKMKSDPFYYDPLIAGWWAWGMSSWIGSGWCRLGQEKVPSVRPNLRPKQGLEGGHVINKAPHKRPLLSHAGGIGEHRPSIEEQGGIFAYFEELAARMRRVRVCCGDWKRVVKPSVTVNIGLTGVFFDPPYSDDKRAEKLYGVDSMKVAIDVQEWCIKHGDNEVLRIALCGLEGEHNVLLQHGWTVTEWMANGGYGGQNKKKKNKNRDRERIWFSPHCLPRVDVLTDQMIAGGLEGLSSLPLFNFNGINNQNI